MSRYRLFLLIVFLAVWAWSASNPPSFSYWMLENVPVFIGIALFILFRRFFKLSDVSYTLILLYLFLPLVTFHYGVTGVPFGFTLGEWFGTTKNVYDKLVHFGFGLLWFYPIEEFLTHIKKEYNFDYYVSFISILAFSALYEVFEALAAVTVNPVLAAQFYGAQGDIFDAQKDMGVATIGAIIAMSVTFFVRRYNKSKELNLVS